MKEVKKTNNIMIRENNKKSSREDIPTKAKATFTINEKKRVSRNEVIETQK